MVMARFIAGRIAGAVLKKATSGGDGFTIEAKTTGGEKIRAILDQAEKSRRKRVVVGILGGEYPDGTPIANVAAIQEFGSPGSIPERPFFRQSISEIERDLPKQLKGLVDPTTMTISDRDAARIGAFAAEIIRGRIRDLRTPPNAASTIAIKGSDNPLVDTGELEGAVDHRAE